MPPNRHIVVEACVGSLDDALTAAELGVDRLEFCAELGVGGLSPSLDDLRRLRATASLPIAVMIRPRGGDFCYSEAEWRSMLAQAESALTAGADAVVFGVLTSGGAVDAGRVRQMVALVHGCPRREAVFHRAFDVASDPRQAWSILKQCRVDRVLTSGGAATALEGAELLRDLLADALPAGGRPVVLAGGGVRAANVAHVLRLSGATQIHAACRTHAQPHGLNPHELRSLIAAIRDFETNGRQNAGGDGPEK